MLFLRIVNGEHMQILSAIYGLHVQYLFPQLWGIIADLCVYSYVQRTYTLGVKLVTFKTLTKTVRPVAVFQQNVMIINPPPSNVTLHPALEQNDASKHK